jgi:uncharacterized membrane protein YwzB
VSGHRVAVIASIVAAAVTISAVFLVLQSQNLSTILAANSSNAGKLTIISVSESLLTNQSRFRMAASQTKIPHLEL